MNEWVSSEVFTETMRRIDAEDSRQNTRLTELEIAQKQISELITSVKILANNMEQMAKEQIKQGVRLKAIEENPGKRGETVSACMITGLVGAVVSAAVAGLVK